MIEKDFIFNFNFFKKTHKLLAILSIEKQVFKGLHALHPTSIGIKFGLVWRVNLKHGCGSCDRIPELARFSYPMVVVGGWAVAPRVSLS